MKINFLGTGTSQGIPVIACDCPTCLSNQKEDKRLRTSILISIQNKTILVDAGPDFRQQMLRAKVLDIDAILLTHEHNDHIIGLDDVRPFNFRYEKDMPIYATTSVQKELKHRFAYIFDNDPYPGAPRLQLHNINKENPFWVDDIKVIPIEVMHGQLPVLGFRIEDFTYITDAKTIVDEELDKIKGTKVLVLNALHHKEHHSHLNLEQAIEMVEKIEPEKAYFTHISHKMGPAKEITNALPKGIELAYDGMTIHL